MKPIDWNKQSKDVQRRLGQERARKDWEEAELEALNNTFSFHPPATKAQVVQHEDIRFHFRVLAAGLVKTVPDGRAWALVKTKLEEAEMWAHKAVAMTSPATRDKRLDNG